MVGNDVTLWQQLATDYAELLPCLVCAASGGMVRLLLKGCSLTLRQAMRDLAISLFACLLTYFILYQKVGQALLFFFALTSGLMSYEFISLLSTGALDFLKKILEKIKTKLN